ncbi:MAG: DUF86 domain-containing protein [Bacteroidales bacterium]|nr:DUF86 domain-containing protein [Bacteroidales bacterium]
MREKVRDKDRLLHIDSTIQLLLDAKKKYTRDEILSDPITFFGFSRGLEIIGEAVYMITKEFREEHPEVPWRDWEKFRHVMVHGYYKVNPEIVWEVLEKDIPVLLPRIQSLLQQT